MTILRPVEASRRSQGSRRRRRLLLCALILAVALVAFVAFWFQPQKLLIDETVSDALPTAPDAPTRGAPEPSAPRPTGPTTTAEVPTVLATGDFISRDHGTSGAVRVLEIGGRRFVRVEELETDNGPDLYLYLTANPADGDEGAFDDDFVSLGRLKGNRGDQNYSLPPGVDLARFRSVVVWCDRFNSAFGAADLGPA